MSVILSLADFAMAGSLRPTEGSFNVRAFGRNADVDLAAAEDVWSGGGVYAPPTAARVHAIVSGSAADAAAGTGARTVQIYGLDTNWKLQDESVTLNGATPVNTTGSYLRVLLLKVTSAGSGGVNAGIITATAATDTTVSASIAVGAGQSQNAIYSVPAGYKARVSGVWFGVNRGSPADKLITCSMWVKEGANSATAAWNQAMAFVVTSNQAEPYHHPMNLCTLDVPEKSDIKLTAATTGDNTDISAGFNLTAIKS